jgi:hypothetical protein
MAELSNSHFGITDVDGITAMDGITAWHAQHTTP